MKFLQLVICFFLWVQPSWATAPGYSEIINSAEIKITEGRLVAALQDYKTAFNLTKCGLAIDYYNAALCALKTGKKNDAIELSFKIAAKGVGPAFFSKSTNFKDLEKDHVWSKILDSATLFATKAKAFKTKSGLTYLLTRSDEVEKNFTTNFDPNTEFDRAVVADSIARQLLKIFDTHGYLSEEDIGVALINDTLIADLPVYATLMQRRNPSVNPYLDSAFFAILLKIGVNGSKLNAEAFNKITGNSIDVRADAFHRYYLWLGCKVYRPNNITEEEISKYRRSIMACSIADHLKKLAFVIKFPKTDFRFCIPEENQGVYFTTHKEEQDKLLSCYIVVHDLENCMQ